ncbi:MAG TPA: protein kinase [Gemmatimonadaceae bacterium]|nr:protein kinase [Gemmatimonadaceae bacterium]
MAIFDKLAAGLESKYRIERELGAGGMALVYLARDLRHDRPVALKLLRPELSAILGGERFLTEIRTTANLQHPHILPLHDSGEVDGLVYYVMPFVEGESLRDRLNREKQLPVEDAVRIAREVANALDYAHRRGVVHRDIKPENILLHDGQALVADFGIALAASRTDGSTRLTETGMSLGTPQYMAPEQAMGDRDITAKSDVYALGCVLYEMLVGEPPFAGPNPQAIVARILTEQPRGLTSQRQTVPPNVEAATLKALQKLPADRFASAAQFSEALGNSGFTAPHFRNVVIVPATKRAWNPIALIAATVVITALATSAIMLQLAPEPPPLPIVRFNAPLGDGRVLAAPARSTLAISDDGSTLVVTTAYGLVRRALGAQAFETVAGSASRQVGISSPAISPDGRSVAYWAGGAIWKLPIAGGTAAELTRTIAPLGIDWDESGIIYTSDNDVHRVSADGGTPEVIIDLPSGYSPLGPQALPGGADILLTVAEGAAPDRWDRAQIFVVNTSTKERIMVVDGGSDARYVPSGHVVFSRGRSLLAVPFDLKSKQATGAPVAVVDGVRRGPTGTTGTAHYAVSNSGVLVYAPGPETNVSATVDLAFTDRTGKTELLGLPSARYEYPRVSQDGKRIAIGSSDGTDAFIMVYDLSASSAIRRLTLSGKDRYPIWSADGEWVVFQSTREGDAGIFRQRADGSGAIERLTKADARTTHIPDSWSPTSNAFLYSITRNDTTTLWLHSLASGTSERFGDVQSIGNLVNATFSPDGKWIAYSTGQLGTAAENYVFVQPFPPTGARYQISQTSENGHHAMWSRDQKSLYYVPLYGQFVMRSITTQPSFTFGNPVQVPRAFPVAAPVTPRTFDIAPDGRVIGVIAVDSANRSGQSVPSIAAIDEVTVVINWFEELKAKVRRE